MTFDTRRGCNKNGSDAGANAGQQQERAGQNSSSTTQAPAALTTTTPLPPTAATSTPSSSSSACSANIVATDIPGAYVIDSSTTPEKLLAAFPVGKLRSLMQKISNPRWVVPVLPEQELEVLLNAAIGLTAADVDHKCEQCMEFYRNALTVSFNKILTDDAVNSWKFNIHHCILVSCGRLLQLIAIHMSRDNVQLLDLLAIVFDPENKFNTFNSVRQPECFQPPDHMWGVLDTNKMYARPPPEPKHQRGWLVDLINRFGQFGGFDNMLRRFNEGLHLLNRKESPSAAGASAEKSSCDSTAKKQQSNIETAEDGRLSIKLLHSFLRPFGQCSELLLPSTISTYFKPIWEVVLHLLDNLSDDELKKEMKQDGRSDYINEIIKSARLLASRLPDQMDLVRDLEMFRLKIILRLLQVSGFNGKLNALNEINKVLSTVLLNSHRSPQIAHTAQDEEMDWLTADCMANWIKSSDVLGIALKESLHQSQYVEKLEKIIRFLIKENALTLNDLDAIWRAQAGKHEAIVKNVHDLLAKLAWDFTPEQLDHLFESFQASMTTANKRTRERLLELIRRLAEDDKNGVMAQKVLKLFWTLAHSQEVQPEVLDQALAAHVKILDYSCSQDRDVQKKAWIDKCVAELQSGDDWALPALRLIRDICCLYETSLNHAPRTPQIYTRHFIIERLQNESSLVILVTNSLSAYMERVRAIVSESQNIDPVSIRVDGRYPHFMQITERLDFLKFLLKDGQLWLCADQAKQIWNCLAVNAVFPSDREECFRWFGKLMGEEPDLDPGINKDFFENNILQLDPQLLTESGIKCFERFFKAVNSKDGKLKATHGGYVLDNEDLIGKDYLWRVITTAGEEIANKATELLKEVSTALGPSLQVNIVAFHETFISDCCERLRTHYSNIVILGKAAVSNADVINEEDQHEHEVANETKDNQMRLIEAEKMCRIMKVLLEYIKGCDRAFHADRLYPPLSRATRGKRTSLYVRLQNAGRSIEDIELHTHSNETMAGLKRHILKRFKGSHIPNIRVDLFYNNGELIDTPADPMSPLYHFNLRDKMVLTAKLVQLNTGMVSSPDTSSDSSTGSPPRPCPDLVLAESENTLPGVIISQNPQYTEFFLKLYQLGSDLGHSRLRESTKLLLHLLPCDRCTIRKLKLMCRVVVANQSPKIAENSESTENSEINGTQGTQAQDCTPEALFLHSTPAQVFYNLSVFHALLIPAAESTSDAVLQLQTAWLHSGCAHFILDLLTKNNFLPNADMHTKRSSFQCVLRLVKLFMYIVSFVLSRVGDEPLMCDFASDGRSQVDILKQILISPTKSTAGTLRTIANKLADILSTEMLSASIEGERCRMLFSSTLQWQCPDISTIKAVMRLAWASSCANIRALGTGTDLEVGGGGTPDTQDFTNCKEALEILSIALVLNPSASEALNADPDWAKFITLIVLKNPSRHVRQVGMEQLFFAFTYCASDRRPFTFMINLLVSSLRTLVPQHESTCGEFFQLLCRTLSYGCVYNWPVHVAEGLLPEEIKWLKLVRENTKKFGEPQVHEELLEGHLSLTKELMFFLRPESKAQLNELIYELMDDFLFTSSREYLHLRKYGKLRNDTAPPPVCRNPHTVAAACDLLIALSQHCVPNMKLLCSTLIDLVCTDTEPLRDWDFVPPIGGRNAKGFCGLKNGGATCYMNSVIQQLYMVPAIRYGILKAEGAATNENEDFSGEPDMIGGGFYSAANSNDDDCDSRKNYHVVILKHVQAIFAHLGHSALQYYIPRGLWLHFKLQGEPVNLREQQDAVEFFMSLFESLDEGLKALGYPQLMNATLGGLFSDQKICQECPHRYSKEEPFSVFSVDIRNHSSLTESLEQYVKGELLEGADAYHCDKCDKKVVTFKRLCVRKLPPVLAIQLKRFEYDYERVCPTKFNDYFEFPRILDMEPYTVSGLAKQGFEVIEGDEVYQGDGGTTKYELTGIVVHSGQASGGHYFSYILSKNSSTGKSQWFKFDDGDVSECKMDEDEELKAQCFGGDYMGEMYDTNLKRMQFRRQKRWWNAYMLFYTRCDQQPTDLGPGLEQLSLAESRHYVLPLPKPIERSLRQQNVRFLHSKSVFSVEFFNFIKKIVSCTIPPTRNEKMLLTAEELSLLGVQLASSFLFHTGFRTKKTLRGPVIEWYDALSHHIRASAVVRKWFAAHALLSPSTRLGVYILVSPSPEVRTVFVKLVVFFCHFAMNDEPIPGYDGTNLCEQVLLSVLRLLKYEAPDYGKHMPHYFSLFSMFVGLGVSERQQLLKLNVPVIFMQLALEEGPGPTIKFQYMEYNKLHQVVSHLIRCCDISDKCQSSNPNTRPLPNPYKDPNIKDPSAITQDCAEILFNRTGYLKKLIEDTNVGEEGIKMIQYCCWENPHFSRAVLTELLWQCGYAYCQDMRHHTELLLNVLLIEDSWQQHRIHNALNGVAEEREGLLETIQRSKTHYQKRAYQIIKCLTQLFHKSAIALQMLNSSPMVARHWAIAVDWLREELERQRGVGGQYSSYAWSPPPQSNENTNGYMLERSLSARNTYHMAFALRRREERQERDEINESDVESNEDKVQQHVKSATDEDADEDANEMQADDSLLGPSTDSDAGQTTANTTAELTTSWSAKVDNNKTSNLNQSVESTEPKATSNEAGEDSNINNLRSLLTHLEFSPKVQSIEMISGEELVIGSADEREMSAITTGNQGDSSNEAEAEPESMNGRLTAGTGKLGSSSSSAESDITTSQPESYADILDLLINTNLSDSLSMTSTTDTVIGPTPATAEVGAGASDAATTSESRKSADEQQPQSQPQPPGDNSQTLEQDKIAETQMLEMT